MAFGIPNASDLNGIVNNLATIVASIGPEAQGVVSAAIEQLGGHADALEDKAIAAEVAAEDKLIAAIKPLTDLAATLNESLKSFDGTVTIKIGKKES